MMKKSDIQEGRNGSLKQCVSDALFAVLLGVFGALALAHALGVLTQ